jgi:esterase
MSRRLGAHYKVFAIDLRNHGRSPHSDIFDYDVMAADLLEFMEQQALRRIMLLGHSMGGKVAMQFAIDYSEQYDRLVIVDIAPKTYRIHLEAIDRNYDPREGSPNSLEIDMK